MTAIVRRVLPDRKVALMAVSDTKSKVVVQTGRCSVHGSVEATKKLPKIRFPYLYFGALRLIAMFGPYRCPTCGAKVVKTNGV